MENKRIDVIFSEKGIMNERVNSCYGSIINKYFLLKLKKIKIMHIAVWGISPGEPTSIFENYRTEKSFLFYFDVCDLSWSW